MVACVCPQNVSEQPTYRGADHGARHGAEAVSRVLRIWQHGPRSRWRLGRLSGLNEAREDDDKCSESVSSQSMETADPSSTTSSSSSSSSSTSISSSLWGTESRLLRSPEADGLDQVEEGECRDRRSSSEDRSREDIGDTPGRRRLPAARQAGVPSVFSRLRRLCDSGKSLTKRQDGGTGPATATESAVAEPWQRLDVVLAALLDLASSSSSSSLLAASLDSSRLSSSRRAVIAGCLLGLLQRVWASSALLVMGLVAAAWTADRVRRWTVFFKEHRVHRDAIRSLKAAFRRFVRESERAIRGDYSRQVFAGYLLHSCTAPGESYVSACVRYRMSVINRSVIQEMEERQLRRLGYQASERDLFQ